MKAASSGISLQHTQQVVQLAVFGAFAFMVVLLQIGSEAQSCPLGWLGSGHDLPLKARSSRVRQDKQAGQREGCNTPVLPDERAGRRAGSTMARIGKWQGQVSTASAPQVAGDRFVRLRRQVLWAVHGRLSACCAGSVGMAASCISRLAGPRADARRVAATRQAAQTHRHRPQHPAPGTAAPVRRADTRFEGSPYKAQPLQRGVIEQAVAARGVRDRP